MRKKSKQISIRVSDEEYAKIQKKIDESGIGKAEFIVKALVNADVKVYRNDELKELLPHLGKVGSNLNQIARKLNENGYVDYKGELATALKGCDDIWQLLRQYLQEHQ